MESALCRLPRPDEPINPAYPATAANPWNQATGVFFQLLPHIEQPGLYADIRSIDIGIAAGQQDSIALADSLQNTF